MLVFIGVHLKVERVILSEWPTSTISAYFSIFTDHILWFTKQLNDQQDETICICIPGDSPTGLQQMVRRKGQDLTKVKKLVFIPNVGKIGGNSIFVAKSLDMTGSHFVMVCADITDRNSPIVQYFDSNGWDCAPDFCNILGDFTALFGVYPLSQSCLHLAHAPTPPGQNHTCSQRCNSRYPLQTCSNVCGVLSIIMMVILTKDAHLFQNILQSGNLDLVDGGVVHLELVRSARPQYMKVSILKEMTNSDGMPLSILMDQLAMF